MEKTKQEKPKINKPKLKEVSLWLLAAGFPLLYVATVRLENAIATGVVLAVIVASATIAAFVF